VRVRPVVSAYHAAYQHTSADLRARKPGMPQEYRLQRRMLVVHVGSAERGARGVDATFFGSRPRASAIAFTVRPTERTFSCSTERFGPTLNSNAEVSNLIFFSSLARIGNQALMRSSGVIPDDHEPFLAALAM
jgi:hypothetical protein